MDDEELKVVGVRVGANEKAMMRDLWSGVCESYSIALLLSDGINYPITWCSSDTLAQHSASLSLPKTISQNTTSPLFLHSSQISSISLLS